ncbi:hypothetical protein JTE90_028202 [Oedothorax gibbosus]|uniref:Uncharacterized protein n=1 Tax=Oedothorax gibbosus TaxID=931172 RepID=A0AAV6TMA6_9ARAC|nr:hypothetical protein JTE90_028202 [Oedothorax gibbosus]
MSFQGLRGADSPWTTRPRRRLGEAVRFRGGLPRGTDGILHTGARSERHARGAGSRGPKAYLRSARRAPRGRPTATGWVPRPASAAQLGGWRAAPCPGAVVCGGGECLALADRIGRQEEGLLRHRRRCRIQVRTVEEKFSPAASHFPAPGPLWGPFCPQPKKPPAPGPCPWPSPSPKPHPGPWENPPTRCTTQAKNPKG